MLPKTAKKQFEIKKNEIIRKNLRKKIPKPKTLKNPGWLGQKKGFLPTLPTCLDNKKRIACMSEEGEKAAMYSSMK